MCIVPTQARISLGRDPKIFASMRLFFWLGFIYLSLSQPLQAFPYLDVECEEKKVQIRVKSRGSDFFFLTTGFVSSSSAQYTSTTCVTSAFSKWSSSSTADDPIDRKLKLKKKTAILELSNCFHEQLAQGFGDCLSGILGLLELPHQDMPYAIALLRGAYEKFPTKDVAFTVASINLLETHHLIPPQDLF